MKFKQIGNTIVIHYLKHKVGVVDFAKGQGLVNFKILPIRGLNKVA